ncbi:hypothetical protein M8J75_009748 [Diaphorina citri]|nr:hypothetical protein M8J75_009748 [Diaphorina citri]
MLLPGVDVPQKTTSPAHREPGAPRAPSQPPSTLPGSLKLNSCSLCGEKVYLAQRFAFNARLFHRTCFKCARCQSQLTCINAYETHTGQFCCEVCPDEEERSLTDPLRSSDRPDGHHATGDDRYHAELNSDKSTNLLTDSEPSTHCDSNLVTASVESTNMERNMDNDDLNILNKCTTDDDKVNSVQNSIRFFDKPAPTKPKPDMKQYNAKSVWNDLDQDDGKRWSYQKAIESKYNNKDKEDITESKQSIILDKINKIKESQDRTKSKLREPTKFKRHFSHDETNGNTNLNLSYKSPYSDDNRRKSLNIEVASNQTQYKSDRPQKIGNINLNNSKLKEFEKVLISNQKKNISNKFENRNSKLLEPSDAVTNNIINEDNEVNMKKLNLNNGQSNVDKINSENGRAKDISLSSTNLTETSFLNISSTSLNKEEIHDSLDEDRTKIDRTIQNIETIAQQIEDLTCNVNNIVNRHKNAEIDIHEPETNTGAIDDVTNENFDSEYNAIGKTLEDNRSIIAAINQSHKQYHKIEMEDAPLDGLEDETHIEEKSEKPAKDIANLKLDLKNDIPKNITSEDITISPSKDKPSDITNITNNKDIYTSNIYKDSPNASPLPDLVIGSVELDEHRIQNDLKYEPSKDNIQEKLDIKYEPSKEYNQERLDIKYETSKDEYTQGLDTEQCEKVDIKGNEHDTVSVPTNKKVLQVTGDSLNPFGDDTDDDEPLHEESIQIQEENIKIQTNEENFRIHNKEENIKIQTNEEIIKIRDKNTSLNDTCKKSLSNASSTKDIDYPEELNPFGDDDEDSVQEVSLDISRTSESTNPFGEPEDDLDRTNPFFSDLEEEEKVELKKTPVPTPRKTYLTTPEPARRAHRPPSAVGGRGSMTSLVSGTSMASRKKKPAPPPPPSSLGVVSPIPPPVSPRTKKRPPPSPRVSTPSTHPSSGASPTTPTTPSKPPSNTENIQPPNSSVKTSTVHRSNNSLNTENTPSGGATSTPAGFTPHKSTYGQWRRKKGHAPPVPIPQRRTIAPMSMENVKRELADIEIKQQELERQGVKLEDLIRARSEAQADTTPTTPSKEVNKSIEDSSTDPSKVYPSPSNENPPQDSLTDPSKDSLTVPSKDSPAAPSTTEPSKDYPSSPAHTEELVLQLFELVNEKNDLLRRQAELMYLRRQYHLEEEHAELEYQIRSLMLRPAKNKTDADKEREEQLIQRLVEVVERRNEIVELLEKDRLKELEEDRSVTSQINIFAQDDSSEPETSRLSVKDTSDTASISSKKHRTLSRAVGSKLIKTLPKVTALGKHHRKSKSHGTAPSSLDSTGHNSLNSTSEEPASLNSTKEGHSSLSTTQDEAVEDSTSVNSANSPKKSKTLKRKILNKIQKL